MIFLQRFSSCGSHFYADRTIRTWCWCVVVSISFYLVQEFICHWYEYSFTLLLSFSFYGNYVTYVNKSEHTSVPVILVIVFAGAIRFLVYVCFSIVLCANLLSTVSIELITFAQDIGVAKQQKKRQKNIRKYLFMPSTRIQFIDSVVHFALR